MTPKALITQPREVSFTVPLVPPSVNHYVKHTRSGRHYVTKEAQAFKEAVALFSRGAHIEAKAYAVTLDIYLAAGQKGDIDNFPKCPLDGLRDAGVIRSDAAINQLKIEKFRDKENPRTEITVRAI